MRHDRMTVADLRATKGRRKMTMLYVETPEEAAAAAAAGIDILSIIHPLWTPAMRDAAGTCFVQVGLLYGVLATFEDYLREGHRAILAGGDSVYCSASLDTIRRLAAEGLPVVGHVGLVPHKSTWTGGFRAVGKTGVGALEVWRQMQAHAEAGAIGVELEVVPDRVGAELTRRSPLVTFGMGAGAGTDVQYLFSEDVLGVTRGHRPRHAKVYRDFRTEFDRLQRERIAAFAEFRTDVETGAYPGPEHLVRIADEEYDVFLSGLAS